MLLNSNKVLLELTGSKTPTDLDGKREQLGSFSPCLANGDTSNIIEKEKIFCFNF